METEIRTVPRGAVPVWKLQGIGVVAFLVGLGATVGGRVPTSVGLTFTLAVFVAVVALAIVVHRRLACADCGGALHQHRPMGEITAGSPVYARCRACGVDWDYGVRRVND